MLGFDLDDQDECDITTEDDLVFLKDQSDSINLTVSFYYFSKKEQIIYVFRIS